MQETKKLPLEDGLKIIGLLITACYVCRFWPLLIFIIGYGIVKIVQNAVQKKNEQEEQAPSEPEPTSAPTAQDLESLAYSVMCQKVNAEVLKDHPGARWVWETPDTWSRLCHGDKLFILLNRAGGYLRAQVHVRNLQVIGLSYETAVDKNVETSEQPAPEEPQDNYELLAFQWVDAHQGDLGDRCREALQNNLTELILTETELPTPESWPDICKQLAGIGYTHTGCLAEGIKIILTGDEDDGDSLE